MTRLITTPNKLAKVKVRRFSLSMKVKLAKLTTQLTEAVIVHNQIDIRLSRTPNPIELMTLISIKLDRNEKAHPNAYPTFE